MPNLYPRCTRRRSPYIDRTNENDTSIDRANLKHEKLNDIRGALADMRQAAKLFQHSENTDDYKR